MVNASLLPGAKSRWARTRLLETGSNRQRIRLIAEEVENEIAEDYELEVPTRDIGELVMKHLAEVDQVAFVRFASVYREFKDARDFVDELRPMLKRPNEN